MQCCEIRELLSGYIDDALKRHEKECVEKHVENCPDCARELADLKQTVRLLQSLGEITPPDGFRTELMQKLASAPNQSEAESLEKFQLSRFNNLPSSWKYAVAAVLIFTFGIGSMIIINSNDVKTGSTPQVAMKQNKSRTGSAVPDVSMQNHKSSLQTPQSEVSSNNNSAFAKNELKPLKIALATSEKGQKKNDIQNNSGTKSIRRYSDGLNVSDRYNQKKKDVVPPQQIQSGPKASFSATNSDTASNSDGSNKYISQTAQLTLDVGNFEQFETDVKNITQEYHGAVFISTDTLNQKTEKQNTEKASGLVAAESINDTFADKSSFTTNIKVKIPSAEFGTFMEKIESLGKFSEEQISGKDMTAEYKDTQNKLTTLKAQEKRLITMISYGGSSSSNDDYRRELLNVQKAKDNCEKRLKDIESETDYAVIEFNISVKQ